MPKGSETDLIRGSRGVLSNTCSRHFHPVEIFLQRQILLVEDDPDIARLVMLQLDDIGCTAHWFTDGLDAYQAALNNPYDLIILDVMLPGMEGTAICSSIRSKDKLTPIMMLTSKSGEIDRVLGLEIGADDYLTKPFSILELQARVKALLRRADAGKQIRLDQQRSLSKPIVIGDMRICLTTREVAIAELPVELTALEFDLLFYFAQHPGWVFTREKLLTAVWGYNYNGYQHTVNSHINRLRTKIEKDPKNPAYILTRWGMGYQFADI